VDRDDAAKPRPLVVAEQYLFVMIELWVGKHRHVIFLQQQGQ
jgi:hypothetical protein